MNAIKSIGAVLSVMMVGTLWAEPSAKDGFMVRQAIQEMQRVAGQIDVLSTNFERLDERLGKLERGDGETEALKAEIAALKVEIASLRNQLNVQKGEIISDLTKKVQAINRDTRPEPSASPSRPKIDPKKVEQYEVVAGDSLFLIAQAFGTTVAKLKELNGLKNDGLRVGQKLFVPKQ